MQLLAGSELALASLLCMRQTSWLERATLLTSSVVVIYAFGFLGQLETLPQSTQIASGWLLMCGGMAQLIASELDCRAHLLDRLKLQRFKNRLRKMPVEQN